MSQVMKAVPETLSMKDSPDMEKMGFPAVGTPEHAALVEAIRLNFPEIYMNAHDPGNGGQSAELRPRSLRLDYQVTR